MCTELLADTVGPTSKFWLQKVLGETSEQVYPE